MSDMWRSNTMWHMENMTKSLQLISLKEKPGKKPLKVHQPLRSLNIIQNTLFIGYDGLEWSWMDVFFKYEYETCTQTFFDCKNSPGLVTIILFSTSFVLIHVLNNGQSEHFIQYEYSILIERRGPGGSVS